jgi:hypothetical protein
VRTSSAGQLLPRCLDDTGTIRNGLAEKHVVPSLVQAMPRQMTRLPLRDLRAASAGSLCGLASWWQHDGLAAIIQNMPLTKS